MACEVSNGGGEARWVTHRALLCLVQSCVTSNLPTNTGGFVAHPIREYLVLGFARRVGVGAAQHYLPHPLAEQLLDLRAGGAVAGLVLDRVVQQSRHSLIFVAAGSITTAVTARRSKAGEHHAPRLSFGVTKPATQRPRK